MTTSKKAKPKERAATTATNKAPKPEPVIESVYSLDEIIENRDLFKTSEDIIRAAFALAEKEEATIKEADRIISNFKRKEVR